MNIEYIKIVPQYPQQSEIIRIFLKSARLYIKISITLSTKLRNRLSPKQQKRKKPTQKMAVFTRIGVAITQKDQKAHVYYQFHHFP